MTENWYSVFEPFVDVSMNEIKNLKPDDDLVKIKDFYNFITNKKQILDTTKKKYNTIDKAYKNLLDDNDLKKRRNDITTSRKQIEMDTYKRHVYRHRTGKLKIAALILLALFVIPIFAKFKLLPKPIALVIWSVIVLIMVVYIVIVFFVIDRNRDDINFKERNFVKPTDHEVARSKMMLELSKKDKDRCNALAELGDDLDPSNFNVPANYVRTQASSGSVGAPAKCSGS
jgi:hypothetical protein